MQMKLKNFFARHPVFTRQEYTNFLDSQGAKNLNTQRELLAYHLKQGHIIKIRQGFYASVPPALSASLATPVDSYLIAGRITNDPVLCYHTALDFFGTAYSIYYYFYYHSNHAIKPFQFQNNTFRRIAFPKPLLSKKKTMIFVTKEDRQGLDIYVTSPERTVVDILDRPDLGGGYEEICRSIEMISVLDIDIVIQYALLLGNATTIAKVGFLLERYKQEFSVSENHLSALEKLIPKSKHYMVRSSGMRGVYIKRWNLIVPIDIIEKNWDEPNDFI